MKKWEYNFIDPNQDGARPVEYAIERMNILGSQGWHYVGKMPMYKHILIMEREIPEDQPAVVAETEQTLKPYATPIDEPDASLLVNDEDLKDFLPAEPSMEEQCRRAIDEGKYTPLSEVIAEMRTAMTKPKPPAEPPTKLCRFCNTNITGSLTEHVRQNHPSVINFGQLPTDFE